MKTIKLSAETITKLFGAYDENVKFIEKELGVKLLPYQKVLLAL